MTKMNFTKNEMNFKRTISLSSASSSESDLSDISNDSGLDIPNDFDSDCGSSISIDTFYDKQSQRDNKSMDLLNSIKENLPEELQRHILKVKHTKCKICGEFKLSNKYYFDCCNNWECLLEYGVDNGIIDETNEDIQELREVVSKNIPLCSDVNRSVRLEYRFYYYRNGGDEYDFCEYYLHTSYPYAMGCDSKKVEELDEEYFKLYKDTNDNNFIFIKDIANCYKEKKKMLMLKILDDNDDCMEIDTDNIWESLNVRYSSN